MPPRTLMAQISCLLAFLLFCGLASADSGQRTLTAAAPNCQTLHSKCTSCGQATKKTPSGSSISYLACLACKGPAGPTANAYATYTNFGVNPPKSTCSEWLHQHQHQQQACGLGACAWG